MRGRVSCGGTGVAAFAAATPMVCTAPLASGITSAPAEIAPLVGLRAEQAERVYADIAGKRKAARYLHLHPQPRPAKHHGRLPTPSRQSPKRL